MNVIAIDFGGTNIKIALVKGGVITASASIPAYSEKGLGPRLPVVKDSVLRLLSTDLAASFTCVAVSMPGVVDHVRGRVLALYEKYEDSMSMDLGAWFNEAFGLPMVLIMDSKAALMGEMHYGCGVGFSDVVMMILGTGVGTAVALDGNILHGRNFQTGIIMGHMGIEINGRKCTCPNNGCIEANASGWALQGIVREHPGYAGSALAKAAVIDFGSLFYFAQAGDKVASEIAERCADIWQAAIVSFIHAYDPALVILSGGIMQDNAIFNRVAGGVQERLWHTCGNVELRRALRPNESVILGLYHFACTQNIISEGL